MAIGLTVRPPGQGEPTELTFDQQRVRIGRGAMCDLCIPHRTVSSVHAMIFLEGDRYFLVDPGSTNGTTLNGEVLVIERRKLLRSGDVMVVAGYEIVFRAGVAMLALQSRDRTAVVARQLAKQVMARDGDGLRSAALVVMAGPQSGTRFEISPEATTLTIGRADDNHIVLDDREASRRHAELENTAEGVVVHDLGGKNPLLINDQPLREQRLKDRDELLVGSTRLVFDEPVEAYLRELAQCPDAPLDTTSIDAQPQDVTQTTPEIEESSPPPVDEATLSDATFSDVDDGEGKKISPISKRSPPVDSSVSSRQRGMSTGTEIAVLFVGALALVICIFALIWIFH